MQELQKECGQETVKRKSNSGKLEVLFAWKDDITKTMAKHAFILGLVVIIIEVAFKFIK